MSMYERYHVYAGKKKKRRTTISLDSLLSSLFQIKLSGEYNTEESYAVARKKIQEYVDLAEAESFNSSVVRDRVICEIAQPKLLNKL